MGMLKSWIKARRMKLQIEKLRLKAELSRHKAQEETQKINKKTKNLENLHKQILELEDMKQTIAETIPANGLIQVLNTPQVQLLVNAVAQKFLSSGGNLSVDRDLINQWNSVPPEVRAKAKEFLAEYLRGGK